MRDLTPDEVVEQVLALRRLTKETGCVTRRTQSELLASLPHDLLREVSLRLYRIERTKHEPQSTAS